jgi:chromosome segregation ATPase
MLQFFAIWTRHCLPGNVERISPPATLAGEFISAEGIVFGGSRDTAADSLLERKARMSVLSAENAEIRSRRDALLLKRDDASAILEKARSDVEETRRQFESADREQSASDNRILFLERELAESEQKIDHHRSEQTVLGQQIQTAAERIAKLDEELGSERAALDAQQNKQLELQSAIQNAAKRETEATERLNELRLALATERQRYESPHRPAPADGGPRS